MDTSPHNPAAEDARSSKSREVRLGVVMYGGVSLAIYSYGVAQELFRAVRGRGVYKLIKALTDSDIVVDVISGTSAGGINGILLAYALCNERDLSSVSALWRIHGDISQLLRSPRDSLTKSTSFLDSAEYYQSRLETAFRDMASSAPEEGEDPSQFSELDLFVTGTDVDGNLYTQFDDAGHPIDVKDHRTVFLLKHRQGRKEPFAPKLSYDPTADPETTYKALATLARITSCFPAAFEPVHVEHGLAAKPADALLQLWGKIGKDSCFLDGGVLDNKPFTYTLKAIFSRTADRAVDRKLFYVEPDPETFVQKDKASQPNLVQAVLASLIGIPGYESIADDLKMLAERNSKLQQYQRLVNRLQPECALPSSASTGQRVLDASLPPSTLMLYQRSRLVFFSDRVIQGLFRHGGRNELIKPEERARASQLIRKFDEFFDQQLEQTPGKIDRLFAAFDVYFRMRRAVRIVYLIYEHLNPREPSLAPAVAKQYREVWQAFNRQIRLYEVIQAAMEALVDAAPFDWKANTSEIELWGTVQAALMKLLDARTKPAQELPPDYPEQDGVERQDWLPQAQLSRLNRALDTLGKHIVEQVAAKQLAPSNLDGYTSVLESAEQYEGSILKIITNRKDPIRIAYDSFGELDAQLYPMEMLAGLNEKDIIETIRISPRDADKAFSRSGYSDKVSGDALYHFGGFFKRSWRSNDILWGRLDSSCQLIETLFKSERLKELGDSEARQRIAERLAPGGELDPAKVFPRAGKNTQDSLRDWFHHLFSPCPKVRAVALGQKAFAEKIELLIEAAQLEVLAAELPNVITDAISEQATWNQFRVQTQPVTQEPQEVQASQKHVQPGKTANPKAADSDVSTPVYDAPSWSFRSAHGRFDPLVAMTAAAEMTRAAVAPFATLDQTAQRPSDTALGKFFKQSYRVGAERLTRDIPALALLEIVAVALLVFRNCVLALFPENALRIKRNPLYLVLVAAPLYIFYALVILMRRAPSYGLGITFVLAILCLLALGIGIFADIDLTTTNLWIFIIGPVMVLVIESFIWITAARQLDRHRRTLSN